MLYCFLQKGHALLFFTEGACSIVFYRRGMLYFFLQKGHALLCFTEGARSIVFTEGTCSIVFFYRRDMLYCFSSEALIKKVHSLLLFLSCYICIL